MAGQAPQGGVREQTRAGHVALVGRPNVGKSTLLNAILGEKLSIVTPKAQTTRERVMGIDTSDRAQIVFVDTPGLLEPRYLLHESMLEAALTATRESDLVLLLLDATRPGETPPAPALDALRSRRAALFVAINKIDAAPAELVEDLAVRIRREFGCDSFRISATTGEGVAELKDRLIEGLPVSEFLYPPDEIAVQPVRFFVAELIREAIFEEYREEVPYAAGVRIEEFRERAEPVYIRANVFVEREGQKAILIGRQGAGIKALGQRARQKVEAFLRARVYLDLWVKVLPGWRRKASGLKQLGYVVAAEAPPAG